VLDLPHTGEHIKDISGVDFIAGNITNLEEVTNACADVDTGIQCAQKFFN
jgi:hypothetical protein